MLDEMLKSALNFHKGILQLIVWCHMRFRFARLELGTIQGHSLEKKLERDPRTRCTPESGSGSAPQAGRPARWAGHPSARRDPGSHHALKKRRRHDLLPGAVSRLASAWEK